MTQVEKYKCVLQLLQDLNCPQPILDAVEVWGLFVRDDAAKLRQWEALSGSEVEGEFREVSDDALLRALNGQKTGISP